MLFFIWHDNGDFKVRIQNKVAIITGATSGIGRASAILFAREGAKIVAVGRRVSEGKKTVDTIHKLGGEAVFIKTDVCRATDVQEMVEKTIHTYHKIDILFNNAGILPEETKTPITNLSEEMWERVMEVNLKGVFLTSKFVIPEMIKGGGGSIVNTASTLGIVSRPDRSAYSASKGGVVLLTKAMAMDYASYDIRVNCVCPSFVETEMTRDIVELAEKDEKAWNEILSKIPLGRPGTPKDVAYASLFLASDESKWITGISLILDGGLTAQ